MHLKLTWRIDEKHEIDLMVNDDQKIIETIGVLVDKEYIDSDLADSTGYVKSMRGKRQINVLLTYKEAQIYSGDIIEV